MVVLPVFVCHIKKILMLLKHLIQRVQLLFDRKINRYRTENIASNSAPKINHYNILTIIPYPGGTIAFCGIIRKHILIHTIIYRHIKCHITLPSSSRMSRLQRNKGENVK